MNDTRSKKQPRKPPKWLSQRCVTSPWSGLTQVQGFRTGPGLPGQLPPICSSAKPEARAESAPPPPKLVHLARSWTDERMTKPGPHARLSTCRPPGHESRGRCGLPSLPAAQPPRLQVRLPQPQDPPQGRRLRPPPREARAHVPATHPRATLPSRPRPQNAAPALERVKPRDLPGRASAAPHEGPDPSALKEPRQLPSWRSPGSLGPARGSPPPAAPPHPGRPPPPPTGYERDSPGALRSA